MNIFSYDNREEAEKYTEYPCLFSDTLTALEQMNICDVVPGTLSDIVDSECPFAYKEAPHKYRYVMPIDIDTLWETDEQASRFDIKQILAAAIYLKYKEDCK